MNKKSITATDLFLAILAVLLISVSFYQTWLGLEQIFGGSSVIIALVLSLILLFLLWQIRITKVRGNSTTGLSWIYFFFASFCFVANFNALYTRFMRTDIYTTELRDINEKFNNLETDVETKLNYTVTDARTRADIRSEINLLKLQITDPKNPGIGTEAKIIIRRIEKLLQDKKITPLTPISHNVYGYNDLADRMELQIILMVYNLSPEERTLLTDISNAVLKWNKDIQSLLLLSQKDIDDMAQGQIDKSLTEYNKLGNRALQILGDKFKFEPIRSKTQEVGKIGYAFDHAIKNFGMFQFVVLMGCILLDFGILLIILLMPSDPRNGNNNNGSVFTAKRSGKTLIPNN